jgi:hypothetical protein
MKAFVVAGCILLGLAGFAAATNIQYQFSSSGDYPGAAFTFPQAVNDHKIAGYYETSMGSFGYLEDLRKPRNGRFLNIEPPGSVNAYASGINTKGVVVGGFCGPTACNPLAADHGFTTATGHTRRLTTLRLELPPPLTESMAWATSSAAFARTAHGFLDSNGVFTELDFPASQDTQANAINDARAQWRATTSFPIPASTGFCDI